MNSSFKCKEIDILYQGMDIIELFQGDILGWNWAMYNHQEKNILKLNLSYVPDWCWWIVR